MNNTALKTIFPILGLTSAIALIGGVNPASVNAATLIGNLPQNDDTSVNNINTSTIKAFSFTIPSGGKYQLDDVILRLGNFTTPADNPVVQIRNDGGANPGTNVLATLTNPPSGSTAISNFTFTPGTAFTFMQNTTYWLYVATTSGGFGWRASSPGIPHTGITTVNTGGNRFSSNGGTSFSNNTVLNSFQINVTPVPELGTVVGLIAFSVGLLATKKRKQDNE